MEPKGSLTIRYVFGLLILAVLSSISLVYSKSVGTDAETKADEIVDPFTLTHDTHSRHKRSVDCQGLECRSLCPWTWVPDPQNGREPRTIFKARCLNASCDFNFAGHWLGPRAKSRLQIHTECDLVYTDIKVWQDDEPAWIPWPIACACSRSRSRTTMRLDGGLAMSETDVMRHRISNTGAVRAIDAIAAAGSYGGYDVVDADPPTRRYENSDLIGAIPATGRYRSSVDTDYDQDTDVQLMSGRRFRHDNYWNLPVRRSRHTSSRDTPLRRFRHENDSK